MLRLPRLSVWLELAGSGAAVQLWSRPRPRGTRWAGNGGGSPALKELRCRSAMTSCPPRPRFTIPQRSDGASSVSSPARSAAHTPPCSHAGFSRAMNNLEAPSINTRSGMLGAHSTRQPHRREGAGDGAEKPNHEVYPGLWLRPWPRRPPPVARPLLRRRRAAAAAPPAAAAGRRRPAARRRLLGGGRAGGGGDAARGAARLRAAGPAAARPGRPAAGGGGYGTSRGLGHSHTAGCLRPRCDKTSRCLFPDVREVYRLREQHGDACPEQPQPPQDDGGRRVSIRRLWWGKDLLPFLL